MIFNYKPTKDAKTLEGHGAEYFERLGHKFTIIESVDAYGDMNNVPVFTAGIVYSKTPNTPSTIAYAGYGLFYTIGHSERHKIQRVYAIDGTVTERVLSNGAWSDWKTISTTADLANYLLKSNFNWGNIDNKVMYRAGSEAADLNNETRGIVLGQDTTGGTLHYPTTNTFFYIITLNYADYSKKQIAIPYDTDGEIYTRTNYAGTWSEWTNPMSTISKLSGTPLNLKGSPSHSLVRFLTSGGANLGCLGFNGSDDAVVVGYDGQTRGSILHTGNSAKVVINSTAPSDTSALWVY